MQNRMTFRQADILNYYLLNVQNVVSAKVYEETADAVIIYKGERSKIIDALKLFSYEKTNVSEDVLTNSGREINSNYKNKLVDKVVFRVARKLFLPYPLNAWYVCARSLKYIYKGINCIKDRKIEVPLLDATAITVSILRNDYETAGSVMFLLGIGEILEEWTHKKSVDDLARSMSLNITKVWLLKDDKQVLVKNSEIKKGDKVVVHMGNMIPFDGLVTDGEAMVNQASLTGESLPVRKIVGRSVYAGTILEEGELTVKVMAVSGKGRYEKIVKMIEETEKLKSGVESKAEHLADKLVPYTLFGTGITYLLTRNVTKALSILMVDFSCALKLAMPIAVLSAIREASNYDITVKGGKYLEAVAQADTIVFDKTGTLTKAKPRVAKIVSFDERSEDELLRMAACMEEHFPHSIANAVVSAAKERNLIHDEMHSKVEYIVAHGISTTIDGKRTVIGSYHFIFEDEKCVVPYGMEDKFNAIPDYYSHLYMAMENKLLAVICIEDPIREEASAVINSLKKSGIKKVVMMTGDSERTARVIASKIGVDEYYSEVLPEDKAKFVELEKSKGRKVIMIGDGINDSPALSASDVGIAISDGAEIAREIADITIGPDNLFEIVTLKAISDGLMKRINNNYKKIVSFNTGLIVLGVLGIIQPTSSALLHNSSTLYISLKSMDDIL